MPIWAVAGVDVQPEITLVRWRVIELPNNCRHFVGYALENREGRVSSRIEKFDFENVRGITSSGRVYALRGRPSRDSNAEYVFDAWLQSNSIEQYADVTKEIADRCGVPMMPRLLWNTPGDLAI